MDLTAAWTRLAIDVRHGCHLGVVDTFVPLLAEDAANLRWLIPSFAWIHRRVQRFDLHQIAFELRQAHEANRRLRELLASTGPPDSDPHVRRAVRTARSLIRQRDRRPRTATSP